MNNWTLLLRQVHPSFFVGGEVTSQAFFPFPKDNGKLSVYDGDQVDAEASHQHYVALELESVGVWAVSGGEVVSVALAYCADPVVGNPAHAAVDFGTLGPKECRKLAKKLKKFAIGRGALFRAV